MKLQPITVCASISAKIQINFHEIKHVIIYLFHYKTRALTKINYEFALKDTKILHFSNTNVNHF